MDNTVLGICYGRAAMRFLLLMKYNSGILASSPVPTLRRNKELFVHLRDRHTTAAVSAFSILQFP